MTRINPHQTIFSDDYHGQKIDMIKDAFRSIHGELWQRAITVNFQDTHDMFHRWHIIKDDQIGDYLLIVFRIDQTDFCRELIEEAVFDYLPVVKDVFFDHPGCSDETGWVEFRHEHDEEAAFPGFMAVATGAHDPDDITVWCKDNLGYRPCKAGWCYWLTTPQDRALFQLRWS